VGLTSSECNLDANSDDEGGDAKQNRKVPVTVTCRLERVIVSTVRRVREPVRK
jgi:hypothetical protein